MTLPDSAFLAAPLWLVTALHLVTFALHLIAMNVLLGALIVTVYAVWRRTWSDAVVMRFVRLFPAVMAATVTLGVAPLLFLQLVFPRQVYASAIASAWFWLGVVAAVIVAYYALYRGLFGGEVRGRPAKAALITAVIGMLYVSVVYSSVFSMAERPDLIAQVYAVNPTGTAWNPSPALYVLRWLHMLTGALAVGALAVALLARGDRNVVRLGEGFFIGGMALAFVSGLSYLLSLRGELVPFMRSNGIWAVAAGVVLALGAIHLFFKQRLALAAGCLAASLFAMVCARHALRLVRFDGVFDPASWRVATQWSPLMLFLACFVLMLGALAAMCYIVRGKTTDTVAAGG